MKMVISVNGYNITIKSQKLLTETEYKDLFLVLKGCIKQLDSMERGVL